MTSTGPLKERKGNRKGRKTSPNPASTEPIPKRKVAPSKDRRKTKASGANIGDSQRHTVKVQLRVGETIATAIADRADELGINKSKYVSQLVLADVARTVGVVIPIPK